VVYQACDTCGKCAVVTLRFNLKYTADSVVVNMLLIVHSDC
jgi:hypothetical protein